MTRIRLISLGFSLLAACGELSRTPGVDAGPGSPRETCDACEPTKRCSNGECIWKCESAPFTGCQDDERCLFQACLPNVAPTCESQPCNRDQACVSTYCVALRSESCDHDDACPRSAFCLVEESRCASAPVCDADGRCHVGTRGAVCNGRFDNQPALRPGKDRETCLIGRCTTNDHCPAPLSCQDLGAEFEGLGVCR